MTDTKKFNYRQLLRDELERRQRRNPAYNVRAFSRDLGMGASRLSEILNGREGISVERAVHFAEKLKLDDTQKAFFIDLVQSEHSRSKISKAAAQARVQVRLRALKKLDSTDQVILLTDWQNMAILELLLIEPDHNVGRFAERLGLREEFVAQCIDRMMSAGYITRAGDKWIAKDPDSETSEDIPSETLRQNHKNLIAKGLQVIDEKPLEERDFSSIIFSMSSSDVSVAKERIREFRKNLAWDLYQKSNKDSVYCLSLQFFELTERLK